MTVSRTSKVFALSLGKGLTTAVGLVSGMVLSRVLSKSDLATYRQTMLAYDVVIPMLSLGVASGIYYFLPTEKSRVRGVVVDGLLMMLGMGLLYAVFIALGGNHLLARRFSNPGIVATLAYLVPLPMVMLPAGLLASVMVVQNRVHQLTLYNILTSLLLATSIIATCLVWQTPEAMILVRVGVSVATGLVAIGLMLHAVPKDSWRPCWSNMKCMVAYSLPLVGATALGTISLQIDKLVVSSLCTPEQFAVYSNGAIEIPLIGILTGSITAVILPDLRRMVSAGDHDGALALFRKAAEKSAVFILPVMLFLMVSAEPFILTLFSSKYSGSVLPFQLYLLILPVRIVHWGSFLMALGKSKALFYRSLAGLCANLTGSILLVHWLGYIGAILSTILSIYFVNCAFNLFTISKAVGCPWSRLLPFRMLAQVAWPGVVACVPILFLNWLDLQVASYIELALDGICYAGCLVLIVWLFDVTPLKKEGLSLWVKFVPQLRRVWG